MSTRYFAVGYRLIIQPPVSGGRGDLPRLSYVLAAGLAIAALPAQAETDWARDQFRNSGGAPRYNGNGRGKLQKSAYEKPGDFGKVFGLPEAERELKKKEQQLARPELPVGRGPWQWKVLKTSWSDEDQAGFEAFVRAIGDSDCATLHDCITSPQANPAYHANNPPAMQFYADCADLPYFLRAYFAWKNNLAFSFSSKYGPHPSAASNRSGLTGNQITERFDIVGPGPDARRAIPTIGQFVSSEHFRVPPSYVGRLLPDHYPVALTRDGIRPGTVIFDPDGHLAVVYKVTDNGLIHYIDSHPDNSLTRGIYARDFARAPPQMGAGFKRWRPQELVGAARAADGTLVGGHIVLKSDRELADWSEEQFYGNVTPRSKLWSAGKFEINGAEADYYDYLRFRLAYPGFKYDPIEETRTKVRSLCDDLKERVTAVNLAIRTGFNRRPQPPRLPNNIYSTSGDWEIYSTPSRDARLKTSFEELRDNVERFIEMARDDSKLLNYSGNSLREDLRAAYRQEASACTITYTKSDSAPQQLSFMDITHRLFKLSFDPYHCVELRWGASDPTELAGCTDTPDKRAWYDAEERLRHQLTRTYGEPMGWSLAQMQDRGMDIGIAERPDVDVEAVLDGKAPMATAKRPVVNAGQPGRNRNQNTEGRQERSRPVVPASHRR